MSDYDRGAYTPQTDAPLAFDPRRPSERRPMPMALIGSAAVLVILLAGVAMVYRGGVRHAGESPRPVGEPVMAVKTAPPTPSVSVQSPAPAQAPSDLYAQSSASTAPAQAQSNTTAAVPVGNTTAEAPNFAAAPEQPAARAAPSAATVAMLNKPQAPNHIVRPSPASIDDALKSAKVTETPAKPAAKAPALRPPTHAKVDQTELAAAGGTRTTLAAASETAPAPAVVHKAKPV